MTNILCGQIILTALLIPTDLAANMNRVTLKLRCIDCPQMRLRDYLPQGWTNLSSEHKMTDQHMIEKDSKLSWAVRKVTYYFVGFGFKAKHRTPNSAKLWWECLTGYNLCFVLSIYFSWYLPFIQKLLKVAWLAMWRISNKSGLFYRTSY